MSIEDDDIRDLLPAWALDAVDESERARVEARLAADPDMRREADELLALTADLADEGDVAPPPTLRASILDAIAITPQVEPEPATPRQPPAAPDMATMASTPPEPVVLSIDRQRRNRRAPILLAAAAVLIIALVASMTLGNDSLSRNEQIAAIRGAGDSSSAVLDTAIGGPILVTWSDTEAGAVITGDGIAFPNEDRTYELWLIRPDAPGPESVGIFAPTPDGTLDVLFTDVVPGDSLFAVSDEPAGGSPTGAPTGEIVAISEAPSA